MTTDRTADGPLRVLVVHNRYRSDIPSGENAVVDRDVAHLTATGARVETFFRSSDEMETMGVAAKAIAWTSPMSGASSRRAFVTVLDDFQPHIVHLHNPYPLISPRIIQMCADRSVPVVWSIHNFRMVCSNGLLFRDGEICRLCEDTRLPWPGVAHKCYRGSRLQSAAIAGGIALHRRAWNEVTSFIAVSEFVADRMRMWGVAPDRIVVKPNAVPDPGLPADMGSGFLFAGRLSDEKGVHLLLDAWKRADFRGSQRLVIAGGGPLAEVVRRASAENASIEYAGMLSQDELVELRRSTAVSVICSEWFETHSSAPESFACGRPVVATRVGALTDVVDDQVGWLVDLTAESLAQGLRDAADGRAVADKGRVARRRYESTYSDVVVGRALDQIYSEALDRR